MMVADGKFLAKVKIRMLYYAKSAEILQSKIIMLKITFKGQMLVLPSKDTTSFQRCNDVIDVQTTLYQRQNDVQYNVP